MHQSLFVVYESATAAEGRASAGAASRALLASAALRTLLAGPATRAYALLLLAVLATGCAPFRPGLPSEPAARETSTASQQGLGAVIAQQALAQVGTPYRYGGADPQRGFDCSGLVSFVHSKEGVSVPRTAAAQFAAARKVDVDDLRAGDVVFYRLVAGSRDVTHVGIYTGQGRFVHAPQTGKQVVAANLDDPYYRERFAGAGRFDPPTHLRGPGGS